MREVVCVGRKNKNITIQLNNRINELLRIGEKKVKVNGVAEGIRTAEHIKGYCQFFKETRQYRFIDMQPKLKEISTKKGYVKDWNAVLQK